MIALAIVILLVVLILSNIGLGFYNRISPPCEDADDFFRNARLLPDGASSALGSIPTSTDRYYIGARTIETGIPGVIGLTSHNTSYIGNVDSKENYINPVVHAMNEDRPDCATRNENNISAEAQRAINNVFSIKPVDTENKKHTVDTQGVINEYDLTTEGILARPSYMLKSVTGLQRNVSHKTLRDGYSDRRTQNEI